MSQYAFMYAPTYGPAIPMAPLQGGIAGLGGLGPNAPLARGLAGQVSQGPLNLPRLGGTMADDIAALRPPPTINGLAGQVPMGAGAQAFDDALALGGQAAGRGSLVSRLPGLPSLPKFGVLNPEASGVMRFVRPGISHPFWRGAGYGLAGEAAGLGLDALNIGGNESIADQALRGAARGAGMAAAASAFLPVSTPFAALAGGVLGAGAELLDVGSWFGDGGGEDTPKPVDVLADAMLQAGLTPEQTEEINTVFQTQMALAEGKEGDDKKAAELAAFDAASALVLAAVQEQQSAAAMTGPDMLALQQAAQQTFAPLANNIREGADLYSQAVDSIMPSLSAEAQAFTKAQVARESSSANRLADAYMAQAALTPVANALTQYQRDQQSYASQLWQQQVAAGMPGAGGTSSSDLLASIPTG